MFPAQHIILPEELMHFEMTYEKDSEITLTVVKEANNTLDPLAVARLDKISN